MPLPLIPYRSGVAYGSAEAALHMDIFIDIQCPHSQLAWPQFKALIDSQSEQLFIKLHFITLSNHRQSWDLTKTMFAYADGDEQRFLKIADELFSKQKEFHNGPFRYKTHQDLLDYGRDIAISLDADAQQYQQNLDADSLYTLARTPNRYAAMLGVWGTPTVFINDSQIQNISADASLTDWLELINSLI